VFGVRQFLRYRDRQLVRENDRLEQEVARRTTRIEQDKLIIEKQAADLQVSALLKTRFFANVSHEFRTPLTLLLGPIQYLAKRIADGSTQQLLMAMERNANQLLTLVNSILDLTRLDSHDLVLTEQPADLSQLTQQTVGNFMA
jgi:signal transduction histidine kinase